MIKSHEFVDYAFSYSYLKVYGIRLLFDLLRCDSYIGLSIIKDR
jgi:hypothetical protein